MHSLVLSPQMELWIMFNHSDNDMLVSYLNGLFEEVIIKIISKSCNDNLVEFVGCCVIEFVDKHREEITIVLSNDCFKMKRKRL